MNPGWIETSPTHKHPADFWYGKRCWVSYTPKIKCVGGDMAILPWNEPKIKWPYLRPHTWCWYRNRYYQPLLPYQKSDGLWKWQILLKFHCKYLVVSENDYVDCVWWTNMYGGVPVRFVIAIKSLKIECWQNITDTSESKTI